MVADNRGQVLLIGGLAIAIVFLTAIPLSNSLVVTESASTSETVIDIDRTAEREASVERGLQVLLRDTPVDTTARREAIEDFSERYNNVVARDDGVAIDVTLASPPATDPDQVDVEITYTGPDAGYSTEVTISI